MHLHVGLSGQNYNLIRSAKQKSVFNCLLLLKNPFECESIPLRKGLFIPKSGRYCPNVGAFRRTHYSIHKKSDPPTESLQQTDLSFKANTHYYDLISHYGAKVSMRTSRIVFATCCAICTTSGARILERVATCALCHTVVLTHMLVGLTRFGTFRC